MLRNLSRLTFLVLPLALSACQPSGDDADTAADVTGDETAGEQYPDPCQPVASMLDESACMALPTDYAPGVDDMFPACISDGGTYEEINGTPGAAARIEAYEEIASKLWNNTAPSKQDFVDARVQYNIPEGLSSRVDRREDLHYPDIPQDEWDPGLDFDKQCANAMLAEAYPDRCAGPSKLRPAIEQAFIDGIMGTGDPNVNAHIIKANLVWFMMLSSYKESYSCFQIAGEDCDASWGYYTGGAQRDGSLIGLAAMVQESSPNTVDRFFDGVLGTRCVRDLYPEDMYPPAHTPEEALPADGYMLFSLAWEQLDQALFRSVAIVLRQHVEGQDSCGDTSAANWKFIQILGGYMQYETGMRDMAAKTELDGIYAKDEPTPDDTARIIELIDQVYPCP